MLDPTRRTGGRARHIVAGFVLAVMVLAVVVSAPPADSAVTAPTTVSVDPAVIGALESAEAVRVIVELNEQPMRGAEVGNRDALRDRMRRAHDRALADAPRFQLTHRYDGLPAFAGVADDAALAELQSNANVRSVVLDRQGSGALAESVPMINADDVRNTLGYTGAGVIVAVLDTGMDSDHPDFTGDIAYEECWLLDGTCPGGGTHTSGPGSGEGDHFHGSNVAGIITSNGNVAPIGVAPDAQIAVYKILNASNLGFISDWIAALNDIIVNHPEVDAVNMSLVDNINHGTSCEGSYPAGTTAINSLRTAGVLTFASSGNNGFANGMTFPACVTSAISVGAVSDVTLGSPITIFSACTDIPIKDKPTCWSNSVSTLDVLAPGMITTSAGLAGGISNAAGTSMAAPHVGGTAALMLEANPALTPTNIESVLEATGVPRLDPKNGITTPRIDAYAAVVGVTDPDTDFIPSVLDNCPVDNNPLQENNDGNFIDNSPPYAPATDDKTSANSDTPGDACDPDDDNDGRTDLDEASGSGCTGKITNPVLRDTDGDLVLDGAECALSFDPTSAGSAPTILQCGVNADPDGDKINTRVEFCYYNTNPNSNDTDGDAIGGLDGDGATDGCEIASFNGDQEVSSGDQGMLGVGIVGAQPYTANVDVNKDGVLNSGDQGLQASFIVPPGQCPGT